MGGISLLWVYNADLFLVSLTSTLRAKAVFNLGSQRAALQSNEFE